MKITVNARFLQENHFTGIQNYIQNLYVALRSIDKNSEYFLIKKNASNSILGNVLFDTFLIKRKIRENKANIYHSPCNILPLGKKICTYILTIHDLGYKVLPQYATTINRAYLDLIVQKSLKKSDLVIADSRAIKREIIRYYKIPELKIKAVPLGVDSFFLNKEKNNFIKSVKEKYNLEKKIILTNSAHSPRKNINMLINLFYHNQNYFKEYTLIVCGAIGKNRFQTSKDDLGYNNIRIFGYINKREMRALYQIADLFIYPSLYEGFSLPVLEAMASNCPLLASDIPSIREILPNDDLLFNPEDEADLFEKVNYYLKKGKSEKRLSTTYKETLNRYKWSKSAREMIKIFNLLK